MTDYKTINFNKIFVKQLNNTFSNISYYGETIKILTPVMICAFGIEKEYSNYLMKLRFDSNDDDLSDFFNFIKGFESFLEAKFEKRVKSQLREKEGYLPLLTVKLPYKKGNQNYNVYNDENKIIGKNNINKGSMIQCLLEANLVWHDDKRSLCTCKWNVKDIYVKNCV